MRLNKKARDKQLRNAITDRAMKRVRNRDATTPTATAEGPRSNCEPHAYQEHPLYPNYCAFAVGDEDYCKREPDNEIHLSDDIDQHGRRIPFIAPTAAPPVETQDCLGCIAANAEMGRCLIHEMKPSAAPPVETGRVSKRPSGTRRSAAATANLEHEGGKSLTSGHPPRPISHMSPFRGGEALDDPAMQEEFSDGSGRWDIPRMADTIVELRQQLSATTPGDAAREGDDNDQM